MRATIQRNTIVATGSGIRLTTLSASDLVIRQNKIIAGTTGILFAFASGGTISENDIDGTASGLDIQAAFTGRIDKNDIYGATVGVIYSAAASLSGNKIRNNSTGVQANVATQATAFGFVAPPTGSLVPNEIYANTLGVALAGQMQWQNVHHNTTGVQGSGSLVAVDFEHANVIESNGTGVDIAGAIQFNRIARNGVGVAARSDQLIAHNLIYRNTTVGIQISGDTDVRITSNTLHSPIGDLIRVESGAKEVQLTNNIFWAEAGYDIYIDNSSQSGFWSDYNMLHASGTGKLVHWSGYDFTDVLDWQEDVAKFDLHSRGRTSVNPTWSEPHFRNMGLDDYRTSDLTAGVRFSNPAIDAGDPLSDLALASAPPNLLTNGSFENGLTGWSNERRRWRQHRLARVRRHAIFHCRRGRGRLRRADGQSAHSRLHSGRTRFAQSHGHVQRPYPLGGGSARRPRPADAAVLQRFGQHHFRNDRRSPQHDGPLGIGGRSCGSAGRYALRGAALRRRPLQRHELR